MGSINRDTFTLPSICLFFQIITTIMMGGGFQGIGKVKMTVG